MKWRSGLSGSVFTRFVAFFLLTILTIWAIAILMYNWQIRQLDQTAVAAFDAAASHTFANMENELAKVKALSWRNLQDEDLLMLSGASPIMSNYQKTVAINRYIRRLEDWRDSSS